MGIFYFQIYTSPLSPLFLLPGPLGLLIGVVKADAVASTGDPTTATAVAGLSLFTYPCVIPCPVSFSLLAVYVKLLLILSLVKFLFNEEADILPREPLNEGGKCLFCANN